jgi:ABC-type multidrug transport system ATPase subunit
VARKRKGEKRLDAKLAVELSVGSKLKSKLKLDTNDLSAGQRSQLAIASTLALNVLAEHRLDHSILILDDITTAMDMAQVPRMALLLRRLAYSEGASCRRQVILTSHHEDLTNRLADFLAPPYKENLRVLRFCGWSPDKGPVIETYEQLGREKVEEQKHIFQQLIAQGMEWLSLNAQSRRPG